MPVEQIDRVTFAVSEDADHSTRAAVKGSEDQVNRLIVDINNKAIFPDAATGAIAAPGAISATGDITSSGAISASGNITGTNITASGAVQGTDIKGTGSLVAQSATAIPVGGTTGAGITLSSIPNFGMFFGSGTPALSAAQGSLYMRTDGTTTNDRVYVNTDGATTWTAINTVA